MRVKLLTAVLLAVPLGVISGCNESSPEAGMTEIERGEYLVTVGGCHDCHTPKVFTSGQPEFDTSRLLSGHPADEKIPPVPAGVIGPQQWGAITNHHLTAWAGPWGVSYAPNLTPDASGTKDWTADLFIKTLRSGKHLGAGRPILPPMPWFNYAKMSDDDLRAVFAYIQSLPPIRNVVPAPELQ